MCVTVVQISFGLSVMGNTHDTEIARIEADYIKTKYRSQGDYRWGYTGDRGITSEYSSRKITV